MAEDKNIKIELTEREIKLLQLVRELGYGEINVLIENGKPVEIKEIRRSVMLDR